MLGLGTESHLPFFRRSEKSLYISNSLLSINTLSGTPSTGQKILFAKNSVANK